MFKYLNCCWGLSSILPFTTEKYHQALGYKTPDQIYQIAEGGGAMIVDYFSDKQTCWGNFAELVQFLE